MDARPAPRFQPCPECGDDAAEFRPFRRGRNDKVWRWHRVCHRCHLQKVYARRKGKPTSKKLGAPSACKVCRFKDYCRQRVQVLKSVACEPGNQYYEHCTVPRHVAVWEFPTAQAD